MREDVADLTGRIDRRGFLGTGAGALAAAATLGRWAAGGRPGRRPRRPKRPSCPSGPWAARASR